MARGEELVVWKLYRIRDDITEGKSCIPESDLALLRGRVGRAIGADQIEGVGWSLHPEWCDEEDEETTALRAEVDRLCVRNERTALLVRTVGHLRRRYAYARDGEVTVSGLAALWDVYDAIGREDGGAA